MLYSGTDPESYITEYTLVYEDNMFCSEMRFARGGSRVEGVKCRVYSVGCRVLDAITRGRV